MSIISPAGNEAFYMRVQSYSSTNPSQKWSNNYCFLNTGNGTYDDLLTAAKNLGRFHVAMTLGFIVTEKVVVSSFAQDTNPYNGDEFTVWDVNEAGTRLGQTGSPLALEICLFMRKQTRTGRTGKTFMRGVLGEGDVEFGESLFKLSQPNAMNSEVTQALINSELAGNLGAGFQPFDIVIPTVSEAQFVAREVTAIVSSGVRTVNMNKRYYDRN